VDKPYRALGGHNEIVILDTIICERSEAHNLSHFFSWRILFFTQISFLISLCNLLAEHFSKYLNTTSYIYIPFSWLTLYLYTSSLSFFVCFFTSLALSRWGWLGLIWWYKLNRDSLMRNVKGEWHLESPGYKH